MPDEPPPAGDDELLVGSSGEGLQVGEGGVRRVLGKLTSLRLARPREINYKFKIVTYRQQCLHRYTKAFLTHYKHVRLINPDQWIPKWISYLQHGANHVKV
jgi:hypothetical protein